MLRPHKIFVILVFIIAFQACTINPTKRFDNQALVSGLKKSILESNHFDAAVYSNRTLTSTDLHVYISGDGSPWIRNRYISKDPTSSNPLVLSLIEQDSNQSIILGRPCYHQYGQGRNCDTKWWTSHRYSTDVIHTMTDILDQYSAQHDVSNIVLIGFSGGGALAMLLAENVKQTSHVITINGNLDISHWTQIHQFTPLYGSLNPIKRKPLSKTISQLHLFGGKDGNIDFKPIIQVFQNRPNTKIKIYPNYTHRCCWSQIWPEILRQIKTY